jgi:hypothetical protein
MKPTPLPRTSELLAQLAEGDTNHLIPFGRLLQGFGRRGFGVLLLAVTLPSFIPLPIGVGAVIGPIMALIGLQMLLMMQQPWLPKFVRRRGLRRESYARFLARTRPWLERLERISCPRMTVLTEARPSHLLTGLLVLLNGILLSLPIPFTNYPFGILMLLFSMAIIERDGAMMLAAWILGTGAVVAALLLSEQVWTLVTGWL